MTHDTDCGTRVRRESLLGAQDIRDLARRAGIVPRKSLGQNFVTDANTIRRIVRTADISPGETVLEVGPGLGSLTLGLLDAARRVVAVEIDSALVSNLYDTILEYRPGENDRLSVIVQDVLRLGLEDFGDDRPAVLVSNLPYNLAVPILLHLLEVLPSLRHGVVMVQEEVADRIVASSGSKVYGIPSVKAAWYGTFRKSGTVSATVFWPVPRVSSALVAFDRCRPPTTSVGRTEVFAVIDAAFAHRRKTLRAALSDWAGGSSALAEQYLLEAGIDPGVRGEKLGIGEFSRIAERKAFRCV